MPAAILASAAPRAERREEVNLAGEIPILERERRHRVIGWWLVVIAVMVFAMVVLGGLTRLTHSGLSMVEWRPLTGWFPPLSEREWDRIFTAYRLFPQYQELNRGMTLGEFKGIFWLEYLHRLWGRLIGVAFFLPLVYFMAKGWVDRYLRPRLVAIFILGALQGVLGWLMVKSGLVDRPDVSQYRLTAHLGAALVIYAYLLWVAFGLLLAKSPSVETPSSSSELWPLAVTATVMTFLTALSGGLVAGLDAGFAYNTFPLMDGELLPEQLFAITPFYLSFFEDVTTVQFTHRLMALATVVVVIVFWLSVARNAVAGRARTAATVMVAAVALQVSLGIATLVLIVPVALAAAHQAGAVLLLTAALWSVFELRPSSRRAGAGDTALIGEGSR